MAGSRAAVAAAEDHGSDLRAIRTLLTTIFRKYKTEMQVGGTVVGGRGGTAHLNLPRLFPIQKC